jgi:hypothetical protein
LAVFGEVDGGVVWGENVVRRSNYWAGHSGGGSGGYVLCKASERNVGGSCDVEVEEGRGR